MYASSKINQTTFDQFLKQYISKLDDVIDKLNELSKTISSHHQSCNIAKTTGTAISSAGVAMIVGSVLSVPFTGGSLLPIGAGGAAMSLTGGISNVITDYVDYKTSTMILNDIKNIINSKEDFDKNLNLQLKHFGMIIDKLMETGIEKDNAISIAVKGIANGCIDLTEEPNMKMMNTFSTIVKLHHVESAALEALPFIGRTMHISEKSFQFIYNFFGLTTQTGAAVFKTIGRISSVVSVAFTIVDIALLIRDWTSEHPTVEVVTETRKKIQEEKHILQDLLEILMSSKADIENVWNKILDDIENVERDEFAFEHDFVFVNKEIEI